MTEKFGFLRAGFLRSRRGQKGFLSGVALVDVVMLVGFYLFAHSAFVLQPGIRIELPRAGFESGASYQDLVLTLVDENILFFDDQRTSLERLPGLLREAAKERPGAAVLVEADGRVRHEIIVRIYNMARQAGIEEVTLATGLLEQVGDLAP